MSSVGYGEPQTIYGLINENTGFEIIFISYISRRLIITISSLYVLGTYLTKQSYKLVLQKVRRGRGYYHIFKTITACFLKTSPTSF